MKTHRLLKPLLTLALMIGGLSFSLWVAKLAATATLPDPASPLILYANQDRDDLGKVYLSAIAKAKTSIVLLIYNLSDASIIRALNEKSESGVQVTVVCDAEASSTLPKRLNKSIHLHLREDQGLMHLKLLVVDDALVLAGSANLSRYSLRIHGNLVMGYYSPELAHFIAERSLNIIAGHPGDTVLEKNFTIGRQTLEFWFLPNDPKAVERLITLINSAKKSIRIAMFTWTRRDLAQAVIQSALRGVKVEVILDRNASKGSSKKIAKLLYRENIPIATNTDNGLLHHKLMLIDTQTLVNGSANWTKAAFTVNHDCFMILNQLNAEQQRKMDELWEAIKIDAKAYNDR